MIIFLDFDGVLTHNKCSLKRYASPDEIMPDGSIRKGSWYNLDPKCVVILNQLVEITNAKVVVSSTWREFFLPKTLEMHLKNFGFTGEVIGSTCVLKSGWRDEEINEWIKLNNYTGDYIIIDDESYHLENAPHDNFLHIPMGWDSGGLTSKIAKREIIRLLKLRGIKWDH